jgi:hypothetical protein
MVIPTAAVAQTAPQATATTPTVKQTVAAKPRVVCTEEEVTGSKFTKRICTTVQARAERRQDDQDFLKQAQTPGFDSGH